MIHFLNHETWYGNLCPVGKTVSINFYTFGETLSPIKSLVRLSCYHVKFVARFSKPIGSRINICEPKISKRGSKQQSPSSVENTLPNSTKAILFSNIWKILKFRQSFMGISSTRSFLQRKSIRMTMRQPNIDCVRRMSIGKEPGIPRKSGLKLWVNNRFKHTVWSYQRKKLLSVIRSDI